MPKIKKDKRNIFLASCDTNFPLRLTKSWWRLIIYKRDYLSFTTRTTVALQLYCLQQPSIKGILIRNTGSRILIESIHVLLMQLLLWCSYILMRYLNCK